MRWSPPREALPSTRAERDDWQTLRMLLPYLWAYKGRVLFALACLVAAKLATVSVPILLKGIVDSLSPATQSVSGILLVPVALVVAYGALRLSTSLFTELREFFFVNVTQAAMRTLALKTFRHLHSLSLRYHLDRRTGAVTREIDQGIRGISSLISFTLYSILPTLIEISLVVAYLVWNYEVWFAVIVGVSLTCLHRLHGERDQLAHGRAAALERTGDEGAIARSGFAAELRDREIFRQRGLRGPPLR